MTDPAPRIAGLLLVALLSACGPGGAGGGAQGERSPAAADTGYVAPPTLIAAERRAGRLLLSGRAPPGARVSLAAPEGGEAVATASEQGLWSIAVPAPVAAPAMYALSARIADRVVRGEGAVLALPPPGPPALVARPGFGAQPLGGPAAGLRIWALDYDAAGGAAVAGLGPAGARVRLSIDGVQAGLTQADARGRFAVLAAAAPMEPGRRRLRVETAAAAEEAQVMVSHAAPLGSSAYRAVREDAGWRVDWARAGGGVQTTLVFDAAPPSAPQGAPTAPRP